MLMLMISLVASISFVVALVTMMRKKDKKLPPMSHDSIYTTISALARGLGPTFLLENSRRYGSIFRLSMPQFPHYIVVSDSKLTRIILEGDGKWVEPSDKTFHYKLFDNVTNYTPSMFSMKTADPRWTIARKAAAPSFAYSNIYKTIPKLHERLTEMKGKFSQLAETGLSFNITTFMMQVTLDFITTSMFDCDFATMRDEHSKGNQFLSEIALVLEEFALRHLFIPFRSFMFWDKDLQRATIARDFCMNFAMDVLRQYRATHSAEETAADTSILAHLMMSPYPGDAERVADLFAFLIAGHDTTAHSLSWILIELARHPHVLAKVQEEIKMVNPDPSVPFNPDHLNRLEYLGLVIKEGMRLWPVAALGPIREMSCDLTYGEYFIPKGSTVVMPFFSLFRTGIKDPDTFNPERWIDPGTEPEAGAGAGVTSDIDVLKELYIPFASGRRNCIGQNLAMLETKMVLASALREFEFEVVSEVEWEYSLTLKPKDVMLKVVKRERI